MNNLGRLHRLRTLLQDARSAVRIARLLRAQRIADEERRQQEVYDHRDSTFAWAHDDDCPVLYTALQVCTCGEDWHKYRRTV